MPEGLDEDLLSNTLYLSCLYVPLIKLSCSRLLLQNFSDQMEPLCCLLQEADCVHLFWDSFSEFHFNLIVCFILSIYGVCYNSLLHLNFVQNLNVRLLINRVKNLCLSLTHTLAMLS